MRPRGGLCVEPGVLVPQPPERALVRGPVAGVLRALVAPVLDGDGVDLPPLPAVGERVDPVLPVLELLELGVEAAGVCEDLAARERGQADRVAIQQGVRVVGREAQLALPVAEELHAAVGVAEARVGLERLAQRGEGARRQTIVGVEHECVRRLDPGQPCVSRPRHALVLLADQLDLGRKVRQRLRGAVVDDHDLGSLAQRAVDGLAQVEAVVEAGDDDRDVAHAASPVGVTGRNDDPVRAVRRSARARPPAAGPTA